MPAPSPPAEPRPRPSARAAAAGRAPEAGDASAPARDFTVVAYAAGPARTARRFDGRWTDAPRGWPEPASASASPRPRDSPRSPACWVDGADPSRVHLCERLISTVADGMVDGSIAEVRLRDVLRAVDPVVTSCVDAIAHEAQRPGPGSALLVEALGTQLAVHLLRHHAQPVPREDHAAGRLSPGQARRLHAYIDEHLQESMTLATLAGVAQLGVWSFARRFRASFGRAPHAFVVDRRLERASRLLERGAMSLKEIAFACGFADQAHMTRMFRARLHTTPARLRRDPVAARPPLRRAG